MVAEESKIDITLDKLDEEFLEALEKRTGKYKQDIFKLALFKLHEELCKNNILWPVKTDAGNIDFSDTEIIRWPPYIPTKTIVKDPLKEELPYIGTPDLEFMPKIES